MNAVRKRLTYANVMSSIAVFLVLAGGTAFAAAQLGKNSVGSKQLKKNAVTSAKLKKNAVTGAKIKPGAVTGAKIDEASLGTVPSAASANVAASLSGYSHKSARLLATPVTDYNAGVNGAPEIAVLTAGPLTVTAKCFTYGTSIYGMFFIKSAIDGVVFDSDQDYTYNGNFLNTTTPPSDRELYYESTGTDSAYYDTEESEFAASAPDGTSVQGSLFVGIKRGTVAGSQGAYGPGDVCLMGGTMFTL